MRGDLQAHGPSVIDTPQGFHVAIGVVSVSSHRGLVELREVLARLTGSQADPSTQEKRMHCRHLASINFPLQPRTSRASCETN